jgi:hypothetical protein
MGPERSGPVRGYAQVGICPAARKPENPRPATFRVRAEPTQRFSQSDPPITAVDPPIRRLIATPIRDRESFGRVDRFSFPQDLVDDAAPGHRRPHRHVGFDRGVVDRDYSGLDQPSAIHNATIRVNTPANGLQRLTRQQFWARRTGVE